MIRDEDGMGNRIEKRDHELRTPSERSTVEELADVLNPPLRLR